MALYPRRVTSTSTTISVVNNDGTQWMYDPKLYKGNQTFTTLQGVRNAISSTGGWAQLNNAVVTGGTKVSDKLLSNAELDQISPAPVMRGTQYPFHIGEVWGSAAFTGYGWFIGCEGGHYAYWGNDMYLVRVADPVGVYRLYNPAPIGAVSYNAGPLGYPQYTLVPPAQWGSLATSEISDSFPSWGPRCTHVYSGMIWDPVSESVLFGGSNNNVCMNPSAVGSIASVRGHLWQFSVNAGTPKSAWDKYDLGYPHAAGTFGMVRNANGTFGMRSWYTAGYATPLYNNTFNASTKVLSSGLEPGVNAPIIDRYISWRPCFRDESTNKYYEINQQTIGIPYQSVGADQMAIYDVTAGNYSTKVANLPSTYRGSFDVDDHGGVVCMNGYAYIWCLQATVIRVNLATGAVDSFTDGTSFTQPSNYNGVEGRWGWVPQAQCFVGISLGQADVYVFRPPSSWGI
jgi:hypothetical protein